MIRVLLHTVFSNISNISGFIFLGQHCAVKCSLWTFEISNLVVRYLPSNIGILLENINYLSYFRHANLKTCPDFLFYTTYHSETDFVIIGKKKIFESLCVFCFWKWGSYYQPDSLYRSTSWKKHPEMRNEEQYGTDSDAGCPLHFRW